MRERERERDIVVYVVVDVVATMPFHNFHLNVSCLAFFPSLSVLFSRTHIRIQEYIYIQEKHGNFAGYSMTYRSLSWSVLFAGILIFLALRESFKNKSVA